jgi:hypothetical protein
VFGKVRTIAVYSRMFSDLSDATTAYTMSYDDHNQQIEAICMQNPRFRIERGLGEPGSLDQAAITANTMSYEQNS